MKVPGDTQQRGFPGDRDETPSQAQLLMAAAILRKQQELAPDEELGLKGANADAARWRK